MTTPKLSFNTENGRYYHHPERKATQPSITNIIKQKNKPAINTSAIRKVAEYAVDNRERLSGLERGEQVQLIKGSQYGSSDPSRIGDIVHAWVDGFIKTGRPPWDCDPITVAVGFKDEEIPYKSAPITARRMYRQFEGFCQRHEPKWLDAEFTVWSDTHGYAGTADWAAEIRGLLVLGDTKTGKAVYPDVAYQLAALANADFMFSQNGEELPMPKWDRVAALHFRPTQWSLIPVDRVDEAFQAFLGLKANFDWEVEHSQHTLMYSPHYSTDTKGV